MNKRCQDCRYFYQHYVKVGKNRYIEVDAGHCAHPRLKDRKPEAPACERFMKKAPETK